jgi:hypothetical protein
LIQCSWNSRKAFGKPDLADESEERQIMYLLSKRSSRKALGTPALADERVERQIMYILSTETPGQPLGNLP